jgi:hypothetical protein
VQTIDWTPRDKMRRSYELLARYVIPQCCVPQLPRQFGGGVSLAITSSTPCLNRGRISAVVY